MAQRSRNKPDWQIKIAKERIDILFSEAAKTSDRTLRNRYVELARRIGMRYNVKLTAQQKRKFCRYCHSYFGAQTKRRLSKGFLTITCACGKVNRFPYR